MTKEQIEKTKQLGKTPYKVICKSNKVKHTLADNETHLQTKFEGFVYYEQLTWDDFEKCELNKQEKL